MINPIDVVAAIIKKDNLYFIAKRNRNKHLCLKWEFPGGKVDLNETKKIALMREIKEELNIDIKVIKKITKIKYFDKKVNIVIHYYFCEIINGNIKLNEHEDSKWLKIENLKNIDLVEGDKSIISLLQP
jgi:8-oxo-dGTP diphosphatase